MGQAVNRFASQFGEIELDYDIFATKGHPKLVSAGATSNKAPSAPTSVSGTASTNVLSQFTTADAGDYIYAVAAKNRYGESALTQITAGAITVAAGETVDLEFTNSGGSYPATGFVIYRSKVDDTSATANLFPLIEISVEQLAQGYDGLAAGHVADNNRWLPETEERSEERRVGKECRCRWTPYHK